MEHWCIIPARGGSKAIPRKNIAPLAGRPLIAYTINAGLAAPSVTRVVVTTDDPEIAAIAREWGAEAPFLRPSELARDDSPTLPSISHAVLVMESICGVTCDYVTLLQPTSPFTRPDQIEAAFETLVAAPTADAVTTVLEVDHVNHPYNVRCIGPDGSVAFFMPEEHYRYPNRQSKPPFYRFGNLYTLRRATLIDQNSLFGRVCLPAIVDLVSCFDINDAVDLRVAECLVAAGVVNPDPWFAQRGPASAVRA